MPTLTRTRSGAQPQRGVEPNGEWSPVRVLPSPRPHVLIHGSQYTYCSTHAPPEGPGEPDLDAGRLADPPPPVGREKSEVPGAQGPRTSNPQDPVVFLLVYSVRRVALSIQQFFCRPSNAVGPYLPFGKQLHFPRLHTGGEPRASRTSDTRNPVAPLLIYSKSSPGQILPMAEEEPRYKPREGRKRDKSHKRRLNLSRSWHKDHSHTYNTAFSLSRIQRICITRYLNLLFSPA